MALPLLVAVTIGLVWLLSVGVAQIRVVDAARETSRALARGDPEADSVAIGERVAPAGTTIAVRHEGGHVVVVATGRVQGPGGIFAAIPAVRVQAEAVAVLERG